METELKDKLTPKIKEFECYNTQLRIINFIIYRCYVRAKRENRKNWAEDAAKILREDHGIDRAPSTYEDMLKKIKTGKRDAVASSGFVDDLKPKSRYKKDEMYARLDIYIHEFLHGIETNYVGLPANQLVWAAQRYNSVVACEKMTHLAYYMADLSRFIIKKNNVRVMPVDIFEYLVTTQNKFNVYDLDLMEALNENRIEQIANVIKRTAQNRAAIALVSVGGRHITEKEYNRIMPSKFVTELEKDGDWKVISHVFCGGYKDQNFPMKYCLVVIEKLNSNLDGTNQ